MKVERTNEKIPSSRSFSFGGRILSLEISMYVLYLIQKQMCI